jgi:hypothetical protein
MNNLTSPISLTATQYNISNLNINVLSSTLSVTVQLLTSDSSTIVDTRIVTDTRVNFGITGATTVGQLLNVVTSHLITIGTIN